MARHWLKVERAAGGRWLVTLESSDKSQKPEFIELTTSQAVAATTLRWCEVIAAVAGPPRQDS